MTNANVGQSFYQTMIAEEAKRLGVNVDPRHVEGWMRLDHRTLNHLGRDVFVRYINGVAGASAEEIEEFEACAKFEGF